MNLKPDQTPGANQDAGGIPVYPQTPRTEAAQIADWLHEHSGHLPLVVAADGEDHFIRCSHDGDVIEWAAAAPPEPPDEELLFTDADGRSMLRSRVAAAPKGPPRPDQCPTCHGTGSVDTRNGPDCCSVCAGSGLAASEGLSLDVEQIVRETLAYVDQHTPLSVGEPLIQKVLVRLSPSSGESGSPAHNEGSCALCTGWHDAEEAAFMNRPGESGSRGHNGHDPAVFTETCPACELARAAEEER